MKIIIPAIICVFLLINIVYSGTTTISGMYIEHNISTQTSAPDKTLYETANQQNFTMNLMGQALDKLHFTQEDSEKLKPLYLECI